MSFSDHFFLFQCFIFNLYQGVRAGGGLGDVIEPPDGDDSEAYRILFDISFFFFIIVILLAIIQGMKNLKLNFCPKITIFSFQFQVSLLMLLELWEIKCKALKTNWPTTVLSAALAKIIWIVCHTVLISMCKRNTIWPITCKLIFSRKFPIKN